MYRRNYLMSSRVDTMRWLGILQLIIGLLIFIVAIIMASIDLRNVVDNYSDLLGNPKDEDDGRPFRLGLLLPSLQVIWFVVPLVAVSVAAGAAGSIMSRFEGLQYNISARNTLLSLSTMNGIISLAYLVFGGLITFELADAGFLSADDNDVTAVMALMVVIYVLAFFDMFVAFICVFICACWNPPTDQAEKVTAPVVTERIIEEKPRDYYRPREVYSDSPYYGGGRSRTLPALKYY